MYDYQIKLWGENNFIIDDGLIKINYLSSPSLFEIIKNLEKDGIQGPTLIRFPHLIKNKIDSLYKSFNQAIKYYSYPNTFNAVFPLKVNQSYGFIKHIVDIGKAYNYGLEAGSKAELILAMSMLSKPSPISVNGFKDREMISLAFIASKMGHNITLTIEGLNELELIIDILEEFKDHSPKIGIRARLHSFGLGKWAKSGGVNSKFGLSSTELIKAISLLKENNFLSNFTMIHFHLGSQISEIYPVKKALREVGNIYAELKKMGAFNLEIINIGGGLAVEYSQIANKNDKNYTLEEFANDVIFTLKDISKSKGVNPPKIFTESGRFIAANHAVLIAPVLELFGQDYTEKSLKLKKVNPPLIDELNELYTCIDKKYAKEYLHDALDHIESLLTLFDLGYIDLEDRSNAEVLVNLIIKKALKLLKDNDNSELLKISYRLREKYLVNISLFQSMPDFWGLNQNFPIMPIHYLDTKPIVPASLCDITCDSDGEIDFNIANPLYLHDIDIKKQDYFLGFFLLGAYQEALAMDHNLFSKPNEVTVIIDNDTYKLVDLKYSNDIISIIKGLSYDSNFLIEELYKQINNSSLISEIEKKSLLSKLNLYLKQDSYLKTII